MPKILSADKHAAIIGVGGALRIVDLPRRCRGYANGCICKPCKEREARAHRIAKRYDSPALRFCQCDRPIPGTDKGCGKCGHRIQLKAA